MKSKTQLTADATTRQVPEEVRPAKGSLLVPVPKLGLSVAEAAVSVGLSVWVVRQAIGRGELKAKRAGHQQVVLPDDLSRWLQNLDAVTPSASYSQRYRAASLKKLRERAA